MTGSTGSPVVAGRAPHALMAPVLASLLCCGMAAVRALYLGRIAYGFFVWNLFLAWVPLALSLVLVRRHGAGQRAGRLETVAVGALWLAFFPNAPYIVTDLVHLRARSPIPLWFDAMMIFAFALTGLCVAFVSLRLVHELVERHRGRRAGWLFVGAVAVLTGVGIYLGRFLRWNSWDLVTRPGEILADVSSWFLDPTSHVRSVGITIGFAGFFGASYLMLFALTRLRGSELVRRD